MEYNFDDGLSEDWISQPRSSTPSLLKENNVLVKGGSIDAAAGASGARRGKDDRVLCDRTNSALNVKKTRPLEKSSKEEDLSVLHDSNASLGSLQSVPRGTVQHKDDIAAASHHTKETPEWKRRVLEGQKGPGRQHDLFAPMGLESVFKPPTSKGKPQFLQSRLKDRKENRPPLQPTEVFPSSPPPYPSHYYQPLQEDLESSIQLPPLKNSRAIPITNSQAITSSNQSAGGQNEKEYEAMSFVQVNGGRINYESVHQSARRLRVAMQNLGIEEQPRPSSRSSDNGVDYRPKGALGHRNEDNEEADLGDCTSTSLPRDLSADSVNLKSNGGFVTTRRGGYSSDESFQRRPLSPSSFVPPQSSQILNRSSSAASAGSVIRSPRTPRRHLSRSKSSPAVAKPSGSPLKIFSKYDTFTNDKLNRRISQFDTGSYQSGGDEMIVSTPSPRKNRELQERDVDVDDAFRGKRISSFGFGELDEFNFSHRQTKSSVEEPDPKLEDRPDIKSRGEKEGLMSYYEQITTTKTSEEYIEVTEVVTTTQLQDRQLLDGKRPPNSPQKVRNPKRRRMTYENAEVAAGIGGDDYKVLISPSSSSVAGKKRKDARYEESHQEADPSILATRHKLLPKIGQGRPRKPSGVPPSSDHSDDEEEIRIDIDAAAGALADELAQLALNAAQGKTKGERKRSVTTADFWNEAQIIMQHIRAQAPYQEVPRSDQLPGIDESVFPESSREQFSRPASREGSVRKQHILKPLDARVVSHLRKFEEQPEISLALNSSFISHKVDQNILASEPESLESDPPNIRISDGHAKRQHELEVQDQNGDAPLPDNGSNRSNSSNQSVPTGSSGASKSRAIIGPEKVSHLLQENMGGMTFDGARGCWIKKKASKTLLCGENDRLPSDVTEDDPLQAIPDLDVDESQEMRNVMGAINAPRDVSNSTAETAFHVPLPPATAVRRTREGDQYTGNKETDSSVVTKYTNFASSGPKVETRATSWGDELKSVKANQQTTTEQSEDHVRESEAELDILKGQPAITSVPTGTRKNQARVVTVAFSSPLVNVINDRDIETANPLDESSIELDDSIVSRGIETRNPSRHRQASTGSKRSFSQAVGPFVHGQGFTTRTISRIEEDDEPAFLDQDELAAESMQLAITTPQPTRPRDGMLMVPPSSIGRSPGVGFHLSPLSEFTINQADHSLNLDVEYMAKRRGLLSTQEVEGTYSLTIKDLVGKLTDVEPFEPYWEYIRRLELQGKKLLTLHMLDEFCQRIEELDVSNNELGQLNGAPQTLRILNVQGNCLSRLTSWGHLHNLQYLDVSDNDLQSLQGFKNLIHLRELNAEGNKIESLEGILGLSGLIRLKVGRNAIKTVDLREANLLVSPAHNTTRLTRPVSDSLNLMLAIIK